MPTQISREIFRKQLNLTFWAFGHPHSYECNRDRLTKLSRGLSAIATTPGPWSPHNVHSELHGTSGTIENAGQKRARSDAFVACQIPSGLARIMTRSMLLNKNDTNHRRN
jgi:hypothetical protein